MHFTSVFEYNLLTETDARLPTIVLDSLRQSDVASIFYTQRNKEALLVDKYVSGIDGRSSFSII